MDLLLDDIVNHSKIGLKTQSAEFSARCTNPNEDPVDKFRKIFAKQREDMSNEVYRCASSMRNIKELASIQTASLSLRQRLLEDSHILLDMLYGIRKKFRMRRGELYNEITNNVQMRAKSVGEKDAMVDGNEDVSYLKMKIELLNGQVEFYTDTMKTMDELIYGIRTRIDMEKMLGAG